MSFYLLAASLHPEELSLWHSEQPYRLIGFRSSSMCQNLALRIYLLLRLFDARIVHLQVLFLLRRQAMHRVIQEPVRSTNASCFETAPINVVVFPVELVCLIAVLWRFVDNAKFPFTYLT